MSILGLESGDEHTERFIKQDPMSLLKRSSDRNYYCLVSGNCSTTGKPSLSLGLDDILDDTVG